MIRLTGETLPAPAIFARDSVRYAISLDAYIPMSSSSFFPSSFFLVNCSLCCDELEFQRFKKEIPRRKHATASQMIVILYFVFRFDVLLLP